MATVVWTGHLAFGMVSVPISLYAAARAETTRFTRLHRRKRISSQDPHVSAAVREIEFDGSANPDKSTPVASRIEVGHSSDGFGRKSHSGLRTDGDSTAPRSEAVEYYRVRQVLQSEADGKEVAPYHMVKGYEYGPGQYVAIEPADYDEAAVETSDTIELFHFVKSDEVDPIYFERSYYVVPEIGGERAYALLLQAMQNQGCWGVARIGMHKREHILILRTTQNGIVAHTMFYAKEVREVPEFRTDRDLVREQELAAAQAVIKGYFGSFEPEKFHDIYQQRLQDLIQAGLRSAPEPVNSASSLRGAIVPDLMADLKRSLAQIEQKRTEPPGSRKKASKNAKSSKRRLKLAG